MITNTFLALFLVLPSSSVPQSADRGVGVCELPIAVDEVVPNLRISASVRCGWITVENTGASSLRFRLLQESEAGTPGVWLGEFTLAPEATLEVPCQGLDENPAVPNVRAVLPNDNPMAASGAITDLLQRDSGRWGSCHHRLPRDLEGCCPVCSRKANRDNGPGGQVVIG
jgi:hypothetical protein